MSFLAVSLILFLSTAAEAKPWAYECKAEASLECGKDSCEREPSLSVEFTLRPKKASVGLFSVSYESKPVVRATASSIHFLVSGIAKSGAGKQKVKSTVVGHISRKEKTFELLADGSVYTGRCKVPGTK